MISKWNALRRPGSAGLIFGAALLASGCFTTVNPTSNDSSLNITHLDPVAEYAQAVQRVEQMRAAQAGLRPDSRVILLTHGSRTPRAIVFVHGLNTSPVSFKELGEQFHHRGYNVLIAPLPYHGLADRMTTEIAQLRTEDMIRYADEVVEIGRGLGDRLTMAGISLGAMVTGWAAQQMQDVDLAVLMSPGFGFGQYPGILTRLVPWVFSGLPNLMLWRDRVLKADRPPDHEYPRLASHNPAQIVRLSLSIQELARMKAPAARSILVITNANDHDVDNAVTTRVVDLWRSHGAANLRTYEFPAELQLGHDLIDPAPPNQKVGTLVYPRLFELIDQ